MAYVMGLIEYLLFVLLSLFTGDEYFYKFHNSIKSIDVLMGYKRGKIIDSNAIIFLLSVITIMRIVIIYCRSTVLAFRFTIIGVYLAIFSLRISYMLITVIFFAMYHRMKFLRKKFEIITIPVTIIGKQKVASKIRLIRKYLINYHHLLDCLRDINGGLQYFLAIMIACNLPKYIFFAYSAIKIQVLEHITIHSAVQNVEMFEGFLFVVVPAIFAELTTAEVERIIDVINRQLLRCTDEHMELELKVALEFIRRRPFDYVIWRTVPLNASLPIAIISLCITYVVIVIQLTQFHDNF
uniref:Gustatory receptor n=1 Tax=Bombyx mori TaxID=7091 RepID=A0A1L7NV12_BOMMO|nr:gustatory receptor 28 [Bombyx mori]